MSKTTLILVGGFLGAGKTTLLARAAKQLSQQGKRVGLITNDQAPMLVDTELLRDSGMGVREIAGGCFCCRFSELIAASGKLLEEIKPDILIAEPVGSCTDLSATVLQPLKDKYADMFHVAPFSVLVDPLRLREILEPRVRSTLHASARYILGKQLEEADAIVLNKIDLLTPQDLTELRQMVAERFSGTPLLLISALTGAGVDDWLKLALGDGKTGQRITDVDYDVYAEGEAVLGWLNATVELQANGAVDWKTFGLNLLLDLQREFGKRSAEIAHLKLMMTAGNTRLSANLTSTGGTPIARGSLDSGNRSVTLTLNARVQMSPRDLQALVERTIHAEAGTDVLARITNLKSLSPGRPRPTHRYTTVL